MKAFAEQVATAIKARVPARSPRGPRGHFAFSTVSALIIVGSLGAGIAVTVVMSPGVSHDAVGMLGAAVVGAAVLIALIPYWPVVLVGAFSVWAIPYPGGPEAIAAALIAATIGLLVGPAAQIVDPWERVVVVRLGRFRRVLVPGPRLLMPIVDRIVSRVDMRIRVTDFSAEKSITSDTVPVHVDALAFWMIWDAQRAILEVESYHDAVTLSAQTALRDAIGKNDLATLLSERERLGAEIQSTLDAKTNPWGITILSVEFLEVLVPKDLEDALSKKAQAEREHQSRVILSAAEVEISQKFEEAARRYANNPTAFQLRAMNMVYDGMKQNKNMVLVPSAAFDSMSLGATLGAAALRKEQDAGSDAE